MAHSLVRLGWTDGREQNTQRSPLGSQASERILTLPPSLGASYFLCPQRSHRRAASSSCLQFALVLYNDGGVRIGWWHSQTLLPEHLDMVCHSPTGLIEAVFDGVAGTREPFQDHIANFICYLRR